VTCGGSALPGLGGAVDPQALAALKAQLREALRAVESAEQQLAERMSPQSVEEVEALEKKLQDALEELRTRKEHLRGRQGGSGS
jgi:signal transduction histidine kinase